MIFLETISPFYIGVVFLLILAAFTAIRSFSLPRSFSENSQIRQKQRLQRALKKPLFTDDEEKTAEK